jgi:hypothetical protein
LDLKNIPRPIKALIGRKAGVVFEYILGGDPGIQGIPLHDAHLVIALPSVITAHQELFGHAGLIERDALVEAVLQHGTGPPVLLHPGAQYKDAVGAQGGGLLRRDNWRASSRLYIQIDERQREPPATKRQRRSKSHFFSRGPLFLCMDSPPFFVCGENTQNLYNSGIKGASQNVKER